MPRLVHSSTSWNRSALPPPDLRFMNSTPCFAAGTEMPSTSAALSFRTLPPSANLARAAAAMSATTRTVTETPSKPSALTRERQPNDGDHRNDYSHDPAHPSGSESPTPQPKGRPSGKVGRAVGMDRPNPVRAKPQRRPRRARSTRWQRVDAQGLGDLLPCTAA